MPILNRVLIQIHCPRRTLLQLLHLVRPTHSGAIFNVPATLTGASTCTFSIARSYSSTARAASCRSPSGFLDVKSDTFRGAFTDAEFIGASMPFYSIARSYSSTARTASCFRPPGLLKLGPGTFRRALTNQLNRLVYPCRRSQLGTRSFSATALGVSCLLHAHRSVL